MAGKCLVISAFLPRRTDAGHRKRTYEACELIRDLGYDITFIHVAFEGKWFWRPQEVDRVELFQCGIQSYHEVYCDDIVGRNPTDGSRHRLDEWWHKGLEGFLENHLRRHFYELVVVHNVWLSKALDFFPASTIKAIETHDIFSVRELEFQAIGEKSDFFSCSESDEVFGLRRADVAIAIKAADAVWMRERSGRSCLTISPRPGKDTPLRRDYLFPDKIVLGFMGSAHSFNSHELVEFLEELRRVLRQTPAPLEFVVAGNVGKNISVGRFPFVRKLGFVERVDDFYERVDIVVSPLDHGTGVKIKVSEAIDCCIPLLSTRHSSEGTFLDAGLVYEDKIELAAAVLRLALKRQPYESLRRCAIASRDASRMAYREGVESFSNFLSDRRRRVVVYMPEIMGDPAHPFTIAALSLVRLYSGQASVILLAQSQDEVALASLVSQLPPSVSLQEIDDLSLGERDVFLDIVQPALVPVLRGSILHTTDRRIRATGLRRELLDLRLSVFKGNTLSPAASLRSGILCRAGGLASSSTTYYLPLFHDSLWWDPMVNPPAVSDSVRVVAFVHCHASIGLLIEQYLARSNNIAAVFCYSSDTEFDALVTRALRSGSIGKVVYFSRFETPLEIATAELLKCFGVTVAHGFPSLRPGPSAGGVNLLKSITSVEVGIVQRYFEQLW